MRSDIDRAADNEPPIAQSVIIHELKKLAPKMEKIIFLPGLGSVDSVSYIAFDNSIRNQVFADRDPKYGYDLRDRIVHRQRTTAAQTKTKCKHTKCTQ